MYRTKKTGILGIVITIVILILIVVFSYNIVTLCESYVKICLAIWFHQCYYVQYDLIFIFFEHYIFSRRSFS